MLITISPYRNESSLMNHFKQNILKKCSDVLNTHSFQIRNFTTTAKFDANQVQNHQFGLKNCIQKSVDDQSSSRSHHKQHVTYITSLNS